MAGHIGKLEQFDENIDSWISYEERLVQYFNVNDIRDEKRVSALLTLIGGKTYGLLRNLTAPEKPADKTYDELCKLLKDHLAPKPLVIAERFRFHKRHQAIAESVNDFVAEIRKLSEHCEFGEALNDSLRDRFVCGLRDHNIQRKLLSKSGLTFQKAVEEAVAMETASKDATELRTVENVHKTVKTKAPVKKGTKSKQTESCKHCGKTNHSANNCYSKTKQCYNCKKTGHIKSVCKSLSKEGVKSVDDSVNEIFIIKSINGRLSNKIMITPEINGKSVQMELDTGSSVSLMSHKQFRNLFGNKVKLNDPESILKTYSGETIEQVGIYRPTVSYNGHEAVLKLCVIKNDGPALFGRDWLNSIKVDWNHVFLVNSVRQENSKITANRVQSILKKYPEVFSDGIGKVNGIKAKLTLKDNAKPVFKKARPVPLSLKPKIERELDNLEKQGIISRVKSSEWATPIVPVLKSDGSVRICGDFKVSLNQELQVDKYPMPNIQDISVNLANGQKFSKIDLRQAYLQLECEDDSKQLLTIITHKGLYRYNRLLWCSISASYLAENN